MAVIDVTIPDDLKAFAESEAARSGYSTVSEYLATLLREAERRSALSKLESRLIQSIDGPAREISSADWDAMDQRFEQRHAEGRKP